MTRCLKKVRTINIQDKGYIDSFNESKTLLINTPILQHPDFNEIFTVTTDASNYALGLLLKPQNG